MFQSPKPTKTLGVLILDDSGSMYQTSHGKSYMTEIRQKFDEMADFIESNKKALGTTVESVIFSGEARTGKRLMGMPRLSYMTNISSGFKAMHALAVRSGCDHCIIVFISDGADDPGNEAKIAALTPLPCKSTLITVAVGEGFPTSLVVDKLRPVYHTYGGDAVPLVIELPSDRRSTQDMESDVEWAVSQVQAIVEAGGAPREYTLGELADLKDIKLISAQCKFWYNACTVKCMSKSVPHDDKEASIKDAKDKFNAAEELMKSLTSSSPKPLPSNLRARRPLFLLTAMREKLNTLLTRLTSGKRMDGMSDAEKAEYLRYGNSEGRFLDKALVRHSVDFPTSLASLLRYLKKLNVTQADRELMDDINLCSWADYIEDAMTDDNLKALADAKSLAGVLETLPFVGRSVELCWPIPDCAQINPWLLSFMVKDLPVTLKGVCTHDIFTMRDGLIKLSSGAKINSVILLGGDPECPGFSCHVQTYCFIRNWLAYFNDIRLIGASMLVMFVMCNYSKEEAWHLEELARARSICVLHTDRNSKWWFDYLSVAETPKFRQCLVTESTELPRYMTCPDLSKFMLATWWLADQGHAFSQQDLIDRCQATVTEFLGRNKVGVDFFLSFFNIDRKGGLFDIDASALVLKAFAQPLRTKQHLTLRKVSGLLRTAVDAEVRHAGLDASKSVRVTLDAEKLRAFEKHSLSIGKIQCFYSRLMMQFCGVEHWEGLNDEMLLQALMTAQHGATSFSRSVITNFMHSSEQKILNDMSLKLAGSGMGEARHKLLLEGRAMVQSQLYAQHDGLPRVIPAEHWLRYQAETGRDISKTWRLDESGLSTVACCFPGCDKYLVIPPGSAKEQKAALQDHRRICSRFSIPGLHRCVSTHFLLPAEQIATVVKSGAELRDPFLPREVTRRLANGIGVYGGVPREFASAEAYKAHALAEAVRGVPVKIQAAINAFTGGDDAKFVELIDRLKLSLKANNAWSYAEFKATFDAKYADNEDSI